MHNSHDTSADPTADSQQQPFLLSQHVGRLELHSAYSKTSFAFNTAWT